MGDTWHQPFLHRASRNTLTAFPPHILAIFSWLCPSATRRWVSLGNWNAASGEEGEEEKDEAVGSIVRCLAVHHLL